MTRLQEMIAVVEIAVVIVQNCLPAQQNQNREKRIW